MSSPNGRLLTSNGTSLSRSRLQDLNLVLGPRWRSGPKSACTLRYPEDTAVSWGHYRCPGGIRGVLRTPAVSWGCHWCPGDATGILRIPAC
eukprot:scaffold55438_cov85-Phaeocystis_antarctica.AAC.1